MQEQLPLALEKGTIFVSDTSQFWEILKIFIGVIAGFLLTFIPGEFSKRKQIRSCKASLTAEIQKCKSMAETYMADGSPKSPSYRMPAFTWSSAYLTLLGLAVLNKEQTSILIELHVEIDAFNRGLDQIHDARIIERGSAQIIDEEISRNKIKCQRFLDRYQQALNTINSI